MIAAILILPLAVAFGVIVYSLLVLSELAVRQVVVNRPSRRSRVMTDDRFDS